MDDMAKLFLIYVIVPAVFGIGSWIMKSFVNRLDTAEKNISELSADKMSEGQVRTLLSDRLEPIREDIKTLEAKVDKIIEYMIGDKH